LEQDIFVLDADSCYANENMETSNADVEQTTCTSTHIETMTQDKEIQVQPFIKTFKTVGTQTEHLHMQGNTKIHPDDINKLCHLEDYSYSLGPNNNSSTDDNKDTVEPCTPVTEEQLTLVECDYVQNGVIVELKKQGSSNDADNDSLSDTGSSYCPSASDDDSETDDEYSSDTAPAVEKKIIVFESQLLKLFKICQHCGSPIDTTTQINEGSMVTIATNCLNGHSVSWQSQPLVKGTAAGNILIPAAILFNGNTYKRTVDFAKYLNL
jgi:hypothetical protein